MPETDHHPETPIERTRPTEAETPAETPAETEPETQAQPAARSGAAVRDGAQDAVFRALSDPGRRMLLDRLNDRNGLSLSDLCVDMGMTRQSVTKHLDVLEAANLVTAVRPGGWPARYTPPGTILDRVGADVLVGFGGYVATPAYLAAKRHKVPIVVHEANPSPGIANRLGARLTTHVFTGHPDTKLRNAQYLGCRSGGRSPSLDRFALGTRPRALRAASGPACTARLRRLAGAKSLNRAARRARSAPSAPPASRCCT